MKLKRGVNTIELNWGSLVVEPDQSTVLTANLTASIESPASVILSPFENISATPRLQTPKSFLITTSDTAPVTASYVIASTR